MKEVYDVVNICILFHRWHGRLSEEYQWNGTECVIKKHQKLFFQ